MTNSITGYGEDYEAPVSRAVAKKFAGMYPLPRMGYEITVAIAGDMFLGYQHLNLQNVSGQFALACNNVKRDQWPDIFKVNV